MISRNLVLGIDTGGTYTDGVLLDDASGQVLTSFKSLTTRQDFALGIEAVIDGIRIDDPAAIKMVSISTTLATNAIAEGKGRRVGLLLIGYDPELIAKFKMAQRFGTPYYAYIAGGHDLYGREKAPLDLSAIRQTVDAFRHQVDAIAVSSYFSPLNPEHETEAYAAIRQMCELPVVLGHQLSTKLGSVERATTAALNASLLAVLQELMVAVRQAMARRNIDAPLMVVRGDGTLMSAEFAADTPVETIHSGPAASAIGGRFLSGLDDALVIDVGGTTTDIALVEGGQVAVSEEGATVNGYKTAVSAANILSIALGGDSHIHLKAGNKLAIGPERVVPLAYLADQYPQVNRQLKSLSNRMRAQATADWLEYWFLAAEATDEVGQTPHEKALIRLLREGPEPVPVILKKLNLLHVGQLEIENLWRQEVLGKSGLTPTDLLHVEGHYTPWQGEAAAQAIDLFYRFLYREPAELHRQVWQAMTEMVMRAVITFLSGKSVPDPVSRQEADDLGYWLFHNSLYDLHPHLESHFRLRLPLIGIGAPAQFVLRQVAEMLHTELVLPEHHAVANAVGTVAGNVMVAAEALIYPRLSAEGFEVLGYYVQAGNGRSQFPDLDEALTYARDFTYEQSLAAAQRAGAAHPQVMVTDVETGMDSYRVLARAIGKPRLG